MLPYINAPFAYIAGLLGASTDESGLLKRIPDNKPHLKNIFIIAVSLFYLVGLFDLWAGIRTLAISSIAAYTIAYYIDGPLMPWIGFAFLMGHMSINHISRHMVNDPSLVDITGAQMVLIMKLTAFCWNVHDGRLPDDTIEAFQRERAIKKLPGFLNYAAFVLFFPSLFAGPAFDYVDYERWIETSMFDVPDGVDPSRAPKTRKKRKIPQSATPALLKAGAGLLWIFGFLQFSGWFYPEFLLSDDYMKYSFLVRVFQLHMVGFVVRMKYYGVWNLTEGACILSGIGYKGLDPKTGAPDWSRLQNVNPLGIEFAQNTRAYLGNWNMNTNHWLRNYMYLRVTPKGQKPGFRASMATFVTSAFWHGFEPGYYMAFVLAAFLQTIAKNCRRLIRPFFMSATDSSKPAPSKRYYDAASWLITQLAFSYTVSPFILLTLPASLTVWARVYFYCIIGVIISLVTFSAPGKAFFKSQLNKRTRPKVSRTESTESVAGNEGERFKEGPSTSGPHLGLPDDPQRDLDELIADVKKDMNERRARGQSVTQSLQEAVQQRLAELQPQKQGKKAA